MGTEELSFSRFSKGPLVFFPASQRRLRCSSFFSSEKTTFLRTALKKLRLFILFSLWLSLPHLNFLSPSLLLLRAPLRLIQKLFFHQGNCWFCFERKKILSSILYFLHFSISWTPKLVGSGDIFFFPSFCANRYESFFLIVFSIGFIADFLVCSRYGIRLGINLQPFQYH